MNVVSQNSSLIHQSVRMSELAALQGPGTIQTLLGSCIGLALYDRKRVIGGLAHILLPDSQGREGKPGKWANTAIPALIDKMNTLSKQPLKLIAKMAGGASMFGHTATNTIGSENTLAVQQQLNKLGIPIIASDCGGNKGRRMTFNVENGDVIIEIVGEQSSVL